MLIVLAGWGIWRWNNSKKVEEPKQDYLLYYIYSPVDNGATKEAKIGSTVIISLPEKHYKSPIEVTAGDGSALVVTSKGYEGENIDSFVVATTTVIVVKAKSLSTLPDYSLMILPY
jgi:hypothetical protein